MQILVVESKQYRFSFQIAYLRLSLYFWTKKRYAQSQKKNKWDKVRKSSKTRKYQKSFDTFFSVNFNCYNQSLSSGRETKHDVVSKKIPDFPDISLFLK